MRYLKSWVDIDTPTEDVVHLEDRGVLGVLWYGVDSKDVYFTMTDENNKTGPVKWHRLVLTPDSR